MCTAPAACMYDRLVWKFVQKYMLAGGQKMTVSSGSRRMVLHLVCACEQGAASWCPRSEPLELLCLRKA